MTKKKFAITFTILMLLLLLHQLISIIKEKNSSAYPLHGMVIVLDPGHGGKDNGAEGQHTIEKKLTLQTAKQLKKSLNKLGATVHLTRESDTFISLDERVTFAEKKDADLFVSIHYNSSPSEKPYGITTYYYNEKYNKSLATTIHNSLIEKTKAYDRDVLFGNFLVLRDNPIPSILLELGFLSNKAEEDKIDSAAYQKNLVEGISNGVVAYKKKEMGL